MNCFLIIINNLPTCVIYRYIATTPIYYSKNSPYKANLFFNSRGRALWLEHQILPDG